MQFNCKPRTPIFFGGEGLFYPSAGGYNQHILSPIDRAKSTDESTGQRQITKDKTPLNLLNEEEVPESISQSATHIHTHQPEDKLKEKFCYQ